MGKSYGWKGKRRGLEQAPKKKWKTKSRLTFEKKGLRGKDNNGSRSFPNDIDI